MSQPFLDRSASGARWQVALVIAAAAVYCNAVSGGFVSDDFLMVQRNPLITSAAHIPDIFTTGFWPSGTAGGPATYYRPLVLVIWLVAYKAFGLAPWAFHVINVALHAATTVLVWRLCASLAPDRDDQTFLSSAFVGALLFALHPLHTEAVTWISGLCDVSCAFFYLTSLLLYARAGYALSAASFFLALLCKEPALTLPVVLVALDHVLHRGDNLRQRLRRFLPFAVATCLYLVMRGYALRGSSLPEARDPGLARALPLLGEYVSKLALPIGLSHLHNAKLDHPILFSILAAVFVLVAFLWATRSRPALVGATLLVVPLAPVLYVPGVGSMLFAERYAYLPSAGFCFLVGLVFSRVASRFPRAAVAVAALAVCVFSYGTIARNRVWQDDYHLWSDVAEKEPSFPLPHAYIAQVLYFREGRTEEGLRHYRKAMQLDPELAKSMPDSINSLGIQAFRNGQLDEAERHFELALQLEPDLAKAHSNLGAVYAQQGLLAKATSEFSLAVALEPNNPVSRENLDRARARR